MSKQAAWASASLAVVIVASLANSANACRTFGCGWYLPGGTAYYGCASSSACMIGYPACAQAGCSPYVGGAGYARGYRPHGVHGSCCLAHKIHRHCAAHRARKYGVSTGGCISGDCVTSGGSYTTGTTHSNVDLPAVANIISDRTLGEGDTRSTPADDESAGINRSVSRLTGLKQDDAAGSPAFERGLAAYRAGSMNDALSAFTMATEAEPSNAMFHYYRALAMFDVAGADAAQDILAEAVEVEKREGVKNWGKRMERVQGRRRLWVEKARRNAGLAR